MQLQQKITAVFFLLLIGLPLGSWWYYKKTRPVPVPIPPRKELTITIIPGWNLTDVAEYLVKQGIARDVKEVYAIAGAPAAYQKPLLSVTSTIFDGKPPLLSWEGYLAPETYRVFADATVEDVLSKLILQRQKELPPAALVRSNISLHTTLTMASIVEDEARTEQDRKMVADILWRRYEKHWALQVDSSVHYAVHKTGNVFTTAKDRSVDSLWNTYKYPGLPPGPICNPSLQSIKAALEPEANNYWYFLTGRDGKMYYARTLEEHAINKAKL